MNEEGGGISNQQQQQSGLAVRHHVWLGKEPKFFCFFLLLVK